MSTQPTNPNRVPAGVKTGGQFATGSRSESDVSLTGDTTDWGHLNISVGSRTPWGAAQYVDHVADGFVQVGTAGHGGMKLSPERNKMIPPALRSSSGWYEEDCEANIPMAYFPDEYASYRERTARAGSTDRYRDPAFVRESAMHRIRDWYPDEYEKVTGETVTAEQSHTRAEQECEMDIDAFRREHESEMVEIDSTSGFDGMPSGFTVVKAARATTGEERYYLVPYEKGRTRKSLPRVINEKTALDVTEVASVTYDREPPAPLVRPVFDTSGLTPAARKRAERELNKLYRYEDGSVRSMRDSLEGQEVRGRSWSVDPNTGKAEYYIKLEGNYARPVSKAVFDAATNLPDHSRKGESERAALARAENALEKVRSQRSSNWAEQDRLVKEARDKVAKARAAYEPISQANREESERRAEDFKRRQREAFARVLERTGVTFDK